MSFHCQAGESLRTSTRTEIGRALMTYIQGECSYRRADPVRRFVDSAHGPQHRGQGKSLAPPYTRGSVPLSSGLSIKRRSNARFQ